MNLTIEIIETLANRLKATLPEKATMTDLEQQTKSLMQEVGQAVLKQTILDIKPAYPEATIDCQCGSQTAYQWERSGQFHTLFGKVSLKRGYYLCSTCRKGCYPLDQRLGLRPNQLSAELSRLVSMTGVELPFQTGSELFEALTYVPVSDQAMGKATKAIGQKVRAEEQDWLVNSKEESFLLTRKREEKSPLRLYGSLDATKVHIRDKKEHGWRDLKIGAWYEASGQPPSKPDGEWAIKAKNIHYFADICTAQEYSPLVWAHGVKHNAQLAQELIFVCDGAEWIWNIVDEHFPNAIQILDWFHASEYLKPVAQVIFVNPDQQSAWIDKMKEELWQGNIEAILEALDAELLVNSEDIIRVTANYYERHKDRMRYADFRKEGYQIGSGTIESAAKQIGMMRLKVPGAIWNEDGARMVAKARAAFLSDRWKTLPLAI